MSQREELVALLDSDHLRSLPVPKKTRKWPINPSPSTYRHHSIVNLQDFWGGENDNPLPKKFTTTSTTTGPILLSITREMAKKRFNAMGREV